MYDFHVCWWYYIQCRIMTHDYIYTLVHSFIFLYIYILYTLTEPQAHYFSIYPFSSKTLQDFVRINYSQLRLGHETHYCMTCILSTFMLLMFYVYICSRSMYNETWTMQVLNIYFRMRHKNCYVFLVKVIVIYSWIKFVPRVWVLVIREHDSLWIRHIGSGRSCHWSKFIYCAHNNFFLNEFESTASLHCAHLLIASYILCVYNSDWLKFNLYTFLHNENWLLLFKKSAQNSSIKEYFVSS